MQDGQWERRNQCLLEGRGDLTLVDNDDVPVSAIRYIEQGFTPLERVMGELWVSDVWPAEHRRSVLDTRAPLSEIEDTEAQYWLVRSPWPRIKLEQVVRLMWLWVWREPPALVVEKRADRDKPLIVKFFGLSDFDLFHWAEAAKSLDA